MRRTFRIWDEERIPDVVFEVTSKATRADDESFKPQRYAQIGVRELVLYDPTGDYLQTQLQLYRLEDGVYVRVEPDVNGALESEELNLLLLLDDGELVLRDRTSGQSLRTHGEAAEALAKAAEAQTEAAVAQTEAAEAQTEAAEAKTAEAQAQAQVAKTQAQAAEIQAQAAESRAAAESAAREKAEAEIRRLREELKRLGRTD